MNAMMTGGIQTDVDPQPPKDYVSQGILHDVTNYQADFWGPRESMKVTAGSDEHALETIATMLGLAAFTPGGFHLVNVRKVIRLSDGEIIWKEDPQTAH